MISETSFPHGLESAALARHYVERTLVASGAETLVETAGLLVSELVVNSTLHARSGCDLRIDLDDERLHVQVHDASADLPMKQELSLTSTGGRGLIIVDALSDSWGVTLEPTGKSVWFLLQRT